ncbi:conjugal transfer protein [Metallosphaera javensis (ex Sakai et al. 2022)]|uniref:conjugal transfer protein n=1 Tax=Metallosphaera javensis (ex Sakai et al. 2022) TaxID=2775498 RepID=UPI00258D1177|nr:MAG: hypothetical protein MjAS7_2272 [Metallosphaera javensis (ex Sakai et al. 2022)]
MSYLRNYLKALIQIGNDLGTEVIATKIQKIFFLLQGEGGKNLGLKFEPWLFGPYSRELNNALIDLVETGEVEELGKPIVDPFTGDVVGYKRSYVLKERRDLKEVEPEVKEFFKKWIVKSRKDILIYVYSNYPKYSDYSIIKNRIQELING